MAKAAVNARPAPQKDTPRRALPGVIFFALSLAAPSPSQAEEYRILDSFEIDELPRPAEEPEGWKQFFEERTILGLGFDEAINDNVFLKDNDKQEDFISTLESQFLFADPRGSTLYGVTYEVNAFRYHRQDENAIDHDVRAFFDLDTGGRTLFNSNYKLLESNSLLLGPEEIDVLRRNTGFQKQVTHAWDAKLRYALNETNTLAPQVEYTLLDDQAVADADSDRKTFRAILDMDHDLRPEWILYGGYEFADVVIPGNELKSSQSSGARAGIRREVSKTAKLDLLLLFEHRRWKTDQQANNLSFVGKWEHELGPRTRLELSYQDKRIPSYVNTRLQFRSTLPAAELEYDLSPLTRLTLEASYEKQRSSGEDAVTGATVEAAVSRRLGIKAGFLWRFREKSHFTLDYSFARSKTSDYTNQTWTFGVETEI